MSFAIEKSIQSMRDIEEAFVFIAEGDLDRAVHFLVAVENTLETISSHPMIGSNRAFENKKLSDLRLWPVKDFSNYLIFYLPNRGNKTIKVVRLLNASRDFDLIFE